MSYHHLTEHERYLVGHLHAFGESQRQIARRLGRSAGTISRELRRNQPPWAGYWGIDAHKAATRRRLASRQPTRMRHEPLAQYVEQGLERRWSPQQIAERLKLDHRRDPAMRISHEAIYQWIYADRLAGGQSYRHLRRQHPRRRKHRGTGGIRGQIKDRVGIERRPKVVAHRRRFGDWESDTLEGAKGRACLATHVERKSRFVMIGKLPDKKADTFNHATIRLFSRLPSRLRRTMTADNGKEFARFKRLQKRLGLSVYFANPYSAWERGANENTNGLLRQFFPKGADLTRLTAAEVAQAARMLNNRPRKCLGYRTPHEVLARSTGVALQN